MRIREVVAAKPDSTVVTVPPEATVRELVALLAEHNVGALVVSSDGTRVDGIYTADPKKDPTATRIDELTYDEAISRGLTIMDQTAFTLCRENKLPMIVFGMADEGSILRAVQGEKIGTLVHA